MQHTAPTRVVLGGDVGGSTTRIAVATEDGGILAEQRGGPGNPASVGFDSSAATVQRAVAQALDTAAAATGPIEPTSVVLGLAGVTTLRATGRAEEFIRRVLPAATTVSRVRLVSDFAAAFASGSWRDRGLVTIAGTGSGAMEVHLGQDVARRDAWGWLLGDDGSGFWLGREAVRAALADLELDRPGPLTQSVMAALDSTTPVELLAAVYRREPRQLAELAPLVPAALPDPVAAGLLNRAADLVADRVLALRSGRAGLPVVLAGALVTGTGPLAEAVRGRLVRAGVGEVSEAGDGLAGALWLALRLLSDRSADTSLTDTAEPPRRWSQLLGSLGARRATSSDHTET